MSTNPGDVYLIRYWGGIDPGFEYPGTFATGVGIEKTVDGAPPATGVALLQTQRWRLEVSRGGLYKIVQVTLTREAPHGFALEGERVEEGAKVINSLQFGNWYLENRRPIGSTGEFTALIVPAGDTSKYAVGRGPIDLVTQTSQLELQEKEGPGKPLLWRFIPLAPPSE